MIRLIIFDVDGTLYDLDDVVRDNYDMQVSFFASERGMEKSEVQKLFEENRILPYKSEQARSATEFFLKNGISIDAWKTYREKHTKVTSIDRAKAVTDSLIERFSKTAALVLLSSNTENNVSKVLDRLEIRKEHFAAVYCSTSNISEPVFSKETAIAYILKEQGIEPEEALSIGDRFATDIEPLVRLGGKGVLIRTPKDLEAIYQDLVNEKLGKNSCALYTYINGLGTEGV